MTNQNYIDLISREPTPDMISEVKDNTGLLVYKYIKKSILQKELLNIYSGHTKWEMLRDNITKGGMWGTGILHYRHPVSNEWLFITGTASLDHERKMRLNYPNLEAHCLVNACKKIGVWFGQTLNIHEDDDILDDDGTPQFNITHEKLEELIESSENLDDLSKYKSSLPSHLRSNYMKKLKSLAKL